MSYAMTVDSIQDTGIQEMSLDEIEHVDGAGLSAGEVVTYTLIGAAAVATGGVGCVVAGTFLLGMTAVLA